MSTPTTLEDLDNILSKTHAAAVAALAKAEQDLATITLQRDQLAHRVQRLSLALPPGSGSGEPDVFESELHNDEEVPVEIPAAKAPATPEEEEAEPQQDAPEAPNRNLWTDVQTILEGRQRAIRTTEILKKLVGLGWQDSEALKNKLTNAFSRWTLQGKLERRGRGLYRLASGEVVPVGDAAAITPAVKSTTVAITPVGNTPVMTAPVESIPAENTPAANSNAPSEKSPKRNLWEDVQSILSGSAAVKTSDLGNSMQTRGSHASTTATVETPHGRDTLTTSCSGSQEQPGRSSNHKSRPRCPSPDRCSWRKTGFGRSM